MESSLISVIVPVYNVQQYLSQCVESILAQTYQNLEIILVDDGSTDDSGRLCDDFAQKDGRVKVLHVTNGGPAKARNIGIDCATGEYIVFVDSDDYVSENWLEVLSNGMQSGVGLFCAAYTDISIYGKVICNDFLVEEYTKKELINCVLSGTGGVLWGKIFRNSIIKQENIRLPENLFMCEDMIFVLDYIRHIDSWGASNRSVYFYNRLNSNSISRKISYKYIDNNIQFYRELEHKLTDLNMSAGKIKRIIYERGYTLLQYLLENINDYQVLYETTAKYDIFEEIMEQNKKSVLIWLYQNRMGRTLTVVSRVKRKLKAIWRTIRGRK